MSKSSTWPRICSLMGMLFVAACYTGEFNFDPPAGIDGGPGGENDNGDQTPTLPGFVWFSAPSRTFVSPFVVEMTTGTVGAEIRYTTDGTLPDASSLLYDGPVWIEETMRLLAVLVLDGQVSGPLSSVLYVRVETGLSSTLPIVLVDTVSSGAIGSGTYTDAMFMLFSSQPGANSLAAEPAVATRAGIRVRGQSSRSFDKKSFRLELWDHGGEDADYPLLEMPAQSDWVLHGPFVDKALIRNAFVYSLGREMGLAAPRFAFVELYLNTGDGAVDEDAYQGVYLLVETIKNCKERLDLKQLDEIDIDESIISGGYIFKFDLDVSEPPQLECEPTGSYMCWQHLEVVDPDPLNSAQRAWLRQHIQMFHDTLFSDNFADATTGYATFVDVASFVDYVIVSELTRDLDAYIRSLYFHKDRYSRIVAGPLWDYNLMAGTGCCGNNRNTEGWQYKEQRNGEANGWFQRLMLDAGFANAVRTRWRALRAGILSDIAIQVRVATLAAPLYDPAKRNFIRWPNLTQPVINYFESPTVPTWTEQVYVMEQWLLARAAWLDTQW